MMSIMKIKYLYLLSAALMAAVSTDVFAQNLDPTVVVNRTYEGHLIDVHKPAMEIEVPDSVTRFDLDFDYSVFDQPYKGAYEFNPYVLTMQPASSVLSPKRFYLRAGAGYSVHPTLDLVWSPVFKGACRMDVYANHRSYFGRYRAFRPTESNGAPIVLDRWREQGGDHAYWKGYDTESAVGFDCSYEWKDVSAVLDASYNGIAAKDRRFSRNYDALDVFVAVSSKPMSDTYFMYDVAASYRFAEDKMRYDLSDSYLGEHVFDLDANLGQVFTNGHKVLFDVGFDMAAYSYPESAVTVGQFHMVPHYVYSREKWAVDAGLRISKVLRSDGPSDMFTTKDQLVYPDVRAWFAAIPDAMRIYGTIGGGNRLNTYSSILEDNHHLDITSGIGGKGMMDVTVERISASLGVDGRIGSKFSYDLRAGYVNYGNALLDAVVIDRLSDVASSENAYIPGVGYAAYQKFYTSLDWCLRKENIRFDGDLNYTYAWDLNPEDGMFAPSPLAGDVALEYNWSRRIYAGADCNFALARQGSVFNVLTGDVLAATIPGYADLGVYMEFATSRSFSFWFRCGNLLNMTIQRNPLYAENGVNITAGICLNL